jgi:hypothetical protein
VPVSGSWWSSRKTQPGPGTCPGAAVLPRSDGGHPAAAGLGNAALRQLLAAPGHRVRASAQSAPPAARAARRADRAHVRTAAAPAPRPLHRGQQPVPVPGSAAGRRRPARGAHASGYRSVPTVYEHGEFAVRGSLMDLFPMGGPAPAHRPARRRDRLPALLRSRDTAHPAPRRQHRTAPGAGVSPRSGGHPAFPAALVRPLRRRPRPVSPVHGNQRRPRTGGAEYYLPLFFERCETAARLPSPTAALVAVGDHHGAAQRFWRKRRGATRTSISTPAGPC